MFLDVLAQYPDIISDYDVLQFRMVGASYQFIAKVRLRNQTELHVKDYLFLDGTRKYSYHWQDAQGVCIFRWDNAPHHQAISTFPFHKHIGEQETITESPPMKLASVLDSINKLLGN
ncbi:MAG: toxin-antitoxin system TumE family protein [Methylococcaceae bacterium]